MSKSKKTSSTNRNSIMPNLNIFGSSESAQPKTESKPEQPTPKYLNKPKYPGTSIPRAKYTPRRSSSQDTLGKRLRVAKMLISFPRISDDTPSTSPPVDEPLEKKAKTPAALQLTTILKDSPTESLKSAVAPALLSPTESRTTHFRDLSIGSVEIETVDMRPDLVPNSPTQYVWGYMQTPPTSPIDETDVQSGFLSLVSFTGSRISRALSSAATQRPTISTQNTTKPEALVEEDTPVFHNTMKQKAPNPGDQGGKYSWRASNPPNAPLPFRQYTADPKSSYINTNPNFPQWDGTSQPISAPDERALQRTNPTAFKEYSRALAAARWAEHNASLAASRAELEEQGKMPFEELCKLAPQLIARRGWVFDPKFPKRERRLHWERERAGRDQICTSSVPVPAALAEVGSTAEKRGIGLRMRLTLGRRVVLAAKERGDARRGSC